MARFPDSQINTTLSFVFPGTRPSDGVRTSTRGRAPLAAYSGGTVWVLHPLRVAAGASVGLSRVAEEAATRVR